MKSDKSSTKRFPPEFIRELERSIGARVTPTFAELARLHPEVVIDRIAQLKLDAPVLDRATVEYALARHLDMLKLPRRPVEWVADIEAALDILVEHYASPRYDEEDGGYSMWFSRRSEVQSFYDTHDHTYNTAVYRRLRRDNRRAPSGVLLTESQVLDATDALTPPHDELIFELERARCFRRANIGPRSMTFDSLLAQVRAHLDPPDPSAYDRHLGRSARRASVRLLHSAGKTTRFALDVSYRIHYFADRRLMRLEVENPHWGIWSPFIDAFMAGLYRYAILPDKIIAVPRPIIRGERHIPRRSWSPPRETTRLHCDDGPAVRWPDGAEYYFIHGVEVSRDVVLSPETLEPLQVLAEPNLEVRRVMVDRMGLDVFLSGLGERARVLDRDEDAGGMRELYSVRMWPDESIVAVRVTCPSTGQVYFLRVPPGTETCREGIAWTFGYTRVDDYKPIVET